MLSSAGRKILIEYQSDPYFDFEFPGHDE